jgi:hypothetical protein
MSLEFHPVPPNYEARKAAGKHTWWVSPYAPDWPETEVGCSSCGIPLTESNREESCRGVAGLVKEMLFTLGLLEPPETIQ